MAIRAILILNGKEYKVDRFGQKFTQNVRPFNYLPNRQVQFGHLEITLETPEHNDILELMLQAKHNTNIKGVLKVFYGEDMPLRQIKFSDGLIIHYKETFNLKSKAVMNTRFVIAAWQMEINSISMHRPKIGYSWARKPLEINFLPEKTYIQPIPLVQKVKVENSTDNSFIVGDMITLIVSQYNMKLSEDEKKKINWIYEIDGKQNNLTINDCVHAKGEKITITLLREWMGKEVVFMPYLKKPIKSVSVKLKVGAKPVIIFVNGYWNTGQTIGNAVGKISEYLGNETQKIILQNVGGKSKRLYWDVEFISKTIKFVINKHKEEYGVMPNGVAELYYDGADIWSSSGKVRYNKGVFYTTTEQFKVELEEKKIISSLGKHLNNVYIISHSMGAAYAEGIVSGLLKFGIEVSYILHFSPADNMDFSVSIPSKTYQINLLPDIVLMYKNFDDVMSGVPQQLINLAKYTFNNNDINGIPPNLYQIKGLFKEHFKVRMQMDRLNHYYTKSGKVWEIISF